jgi:alanine-synthesizing transaminase
VVDLGMGNPDGATPQIVVDKLVEAARNPRNHRYSVSRGIPASARGDRQALSQAAARRRSRSGYGSHRHHRREGRAGASAVRGIGPGDIVVSPNPAYPIHQYGVIMAEGHACMLPMPNAETFLGRLQELYRSRRKPPKMLLISFPHNPTTTCVDLPFLHRDRESGAGPWDPDRARFRVCGSGIRRLQAAQHSRGAGREGYGGRDFLDVEELQHGGVAGRVLPGQPRMIAALARIKSYLDYGVFQPIQIASIVALRECEDESRQDLRHVQEDGAMFW